MASSSSIAEFRQFYARFLTQSVGSQNDRLRQAFAEVERERFVGPGPWAVFAGSGYVSTPTDDPRFLYQDIVISLDRDRGINNGQPSLHARALAACAIEPGESVLHIGTGTGYYTAIAAALTGRRGSVAGFEIEKDLAGRASANLAELPQVTIHNRSGTAGALSDVDVVYVSAGATHPLESWLDALRPGGRLVFPLTPNTGFGVMLCVTRTSLRSYTATAVMPVAFIPCLGARNDADSEAISAALRSRALMTTLSLHRGTDPDESATCVGTGWWLSSAPAKEAAGDG